MDHNLTVGQLLDFIAEHNIPRDAPVFYQRIEDMYFDKHNWKTKNMEGMFYRDCLRDAEKAKGEWLDKEQYPLMTQQTIDAVIKAAEDPEFMESMKEKYIRAWCPVYYSSEPNILFIDAHY